MISKGVISNTEKFLKKGMLYVAKATHYVQLENKLSKPG